MLESPMHTQKIRQARGASATRKPPLRGSLMAAPVRVPYLKNGNDAVVPPQPTISSGVCNLLSRPMQKRFEEDVLSGRTDAVTAAVRYLEHRSISCVTRLRHLRHRFSLAYRRPQSASRQCQPYGSMDVLVDTQIHCSWHHCVLRKSSEFENLEFQAAQGSTAAACAYRLLHVWYPVEEGNWRRCQERES